MFAQAVLAFAVFSLSSVAASAPMPAPSPEPTPRPSAEVLQSEPITDARAEGWDFFDEYDNIKMYRKEIPGSDVLAYRGEGVIDAPIEKLAAIGMDASGRKVWMTRLKQSDKVEHISETEQIEYIHMKTPWPLTDRDFLCRVSMQVDRMNKRVILHFESVEDERWPRVGGKVRAHIYPSRIIMTSIDGGKRTRVEAEAHADPKGAVPKWLVNIYQKRLPRESLRGLKWRVTSRVIQPHPLVRFE